MKRLICGVSLLSVLTFGCGSKLETSQISDVNVLESVAIDDSCLAEIESQSRYNNFINGVNLLITRVPGWPEAVEKLVKKAPKSDKDQVAHIGEALKYELGCRYANKVIRSGSLQDWGDELESLSGGALLPRIIEIYNEVITLPMKR